MPHGGRRCGGDENSRPALAGRQDSGSAAEHIPSHAGCDTADVVGAVDLTLKDLFPSRNGELPNNESQNKVGLTDWKSKAANFGRNAEGKRQELAEALGVDETSLEHLRVGWGNIGGPCWTFPERDPSGNVIGINRRFVDGTKKSVGKRGLTFTDDWAQAEGPVLITEGGSDVAAGLTMGLSVVGCPSCTGGISFLVEML